MHDSIRFGTPSNATSATSSIVQDSWIHMNQQLGLSKHKLEASSLVLKPVAEKGLGVFTPSPCHKGVQVFTEAPLMVAASPKEIERGFSSLSPDLQAKYMNFHDTWNSVRTVEGIFRTNAFQLDCTAQCAGKLLPAARKMLLV